MLQHLKYSLPDWILCLLAATGLSMNVAQSFLLPAGLSGNGWMAALVCAVIITILVICSYSRATTIISVVVIAAGIVALLVLAFFGIVPGLQEAENPEENTVLWYFVVAVCAVVVYLLSRTRLTSWILLILGMLTVAYFAVLEYTVYLWAALLFMFSVGAWICFMGYRKNVLKYSAMRTAFLPMAGWAAVVSVLCLLVGSAAWAGIIQTIDPPTRDLTLMTDYQQMQQIEELGLIDKNEIFDWNTISQWLNEQYHRMTDELLENYDIDEDLDVQGTQEDADSDQQEQEEEQPITQQQGDMDWRNQGAGAGGWSILLILLIILGVLVLAALVVLFLMRRKIWYRYKTRHMTDEEYIRYFYPWYLIRLWRLKMPRPRGDSPMEYAKRLETPGRFMDETGVTWEEISEIFSNLVYGGRKARPGDRDRMDQFFKGFPRACRKEKRLAWAWYALRV